MKRVAGFLLIVSCLFVAQALAETIADVLIIKDIGIYKLEKPFITARGQVVGGGEPTSSLDGNDAEGYYLSYTVGYDGGENYAGPNIEVSAYNSTKWMLHDLESDLKEHEDDVATKTNKAAITKIVDGNPIIKARIGGGTYRWISNDKAIIVSYHDLHLQYSEPMEVVKEYLKKYPSTLSATYQIRHPDREKQFIKEEFDHLLWVSDRWVTLIQEADPKLKEKLTEAADNLAEFARYRRVYFKSLFGDPMADDIELLETAHMRPDQEEFIRAKLIEYKEWWAAHKSEAINFP